MKKRNVYLTAMIAAALLLAGCAGSNTESQKSEGQAGKETAASSAGSSEKASAGAEAASGTVAAAESTAAGTPAAGASSESAGSGSGTVSAGTSGTSGQNSSADASGDLVNMVKSTPQEATGKILGSENSRKNDGMETLEIVNQTGSAIASLYIRPNTESGGNDWGEDLIGGRFILSDNDKAQYYFDPDQTDGYGSKVSGYDIRITYEETGRNECFFRKLPFTEVQQIFLCMEGKGQDAIPYARYINKTTKSEHSTLEEVKQRLGLSGTSMSTEDEQDSQQTSDKQQEETKEPGQTPEPDNIDTFDETPDPGATRAQSYIGMSLEELESMMGSPTSSEYTEEPETGRTGYHYYSTFTVSTTVDDDGNEIVAGIW